MKNKLVALFLCVCALVYAFPGIAYAEDNYVLEISGTGEENIDGKYSSLTEAMATYLATGGTECQMKLLADTEVEIDSSSELPIAIGIGGANSVLDLDGHTLTVTGTGMAIMISGVPNAPVYIKNGTIILNGTTLAGVVCADGDMIVENVSILPGANASEVIGVVSGIDQSGHQAGAVIKNCQVCLGEDNQDLQGMNYGLEASIEIQSGHFSSNPVAEDGSIVYAEGSNALEKLPAGVATGTTVITSDDTTAIIVKEGAA